MTGNKICVNLLRYAAQVFTICYPSSDVYTSINRQHTTFNSFKYISTFFS